MQNRTSGQGDRYFDPILGQSTCPLDPTRTQTICTCHIYAYCLMPNHIHLLLREKGWQLSDIIKSVASSYAFYFNKKYERIGHLFQDRYRSEPCDDMQYFFTLFRYIHQNPVKAGITQYVEDYPYSSWRNDYLGFSEIRVCTTQPIFKRIGTKMLQDLVNMALPDDVPCIDIEHERKAIPDEFVLNTLLQKSNVQHLAAFQSLDKELQKKIAAEVMRQYHIGPRQMSRVSCISYSIVQRLLNWI